MTKKLSSDDASLLPSYDKILINQLLAASKDPLMLATQVTSIAQLEHLIEKGFPAETPPYRWLHGALATRLGDKVWDALLLKRDVQTIRSDAKLQMGKKFFLLNDIGMAIFDDHIGLVKRWADQAPPPRSHVALMGGQEKICALSWAIAHNHKAAMILIKKGHAITAPLPQPWLDLVMSSWVRSATAWAQTPDTKPDFVLRTTLQALCNQDRDRARLLLGGLVEQASAPAQSVLKQFQAILEQGTWDVVVQKPSPSPPPVEAQKPLAKNPSVGWAGISSSTMKQDPSVADHDLQKTIKLLEDINSKNAQDKRVTQDPVRVQKLLNIMRVYADNKAVLSHWHAKHPGLSKELSQCFHRLAKDDRSGFVSLDDILLFFKMKMDMSVTSDAGNTVLHKVATAIDRTAMYAGWGDRSSRTLTKKQQQLMALALNKTNDINALNHEGVSPLGWTLGLSMKSGNAYMLCQCSPALVEILLKAGADINAGKNPQTTPSTYIDQMLQSGSPSQQIIGQMMRNLKVVNERRELLEQVTPSSSQVQSSKRRM